MANLFTLPNSNSNSGTQKHRNIPEKSSFLNQKLELTDLCQLSYVDGNETFVNNSTPVNFAQKLASPGKCSCVHLGAHCLFRAEAGGR